MKLFPEIDTHPSLAKRVQFGLIVLAFMGALGLLQWHRGHARVGVWLAAFGATMLVVALLPGIGRGAYILWMTLGAALGRVTSPIVLLVVYGLFVVPVGVAMRLRGRDTMQRRLRGATSYWEDYPRATGVSAYLRQS